MLHKYLNSFNFSTHYPLHMPGHKRLFGEYCEKDITEIPYFDDLHNANGILKQLEDDFSKVYRSKFSKLSVSGSTAPILSAISAVKRKSDKILVGRQSHKSIYNAIYINGMQPYYIYPKVDSKSQIATGYSYEEIEEILAKHSDIGSMIFTSPTYEGVILDIKRLSRLAKMYEVILIIDEAHGAHLVFEYSSAINLGADIVIQSLHKMLPSLTQTGIIHVGDSVPNYIEHDIKYFMTAYQTSSPSYILMSSMSECIEFIKDAGKKMYKKTYNVILGYRKKLEALKHLRLFSCEDYDIFKIVISVADASITGEELYNSIYKAGFTLEMYTDSFVTAFLSLVDDEKKINEFLDLLITIDCKIGYASKKIISTYPKAKLKKSMNKVREEGINKIDYRKAQGKIAYEAIYLYPPGIPLIAMGEEYSVEIIEAIEAYKERGLLRTTTVWVCN